MSDDYELLYDGPAYPDARDDPRAPLPPVTIPERGWYCERHGFVGFSAVGCTHWCGMMPLPRWIIPASTSEQEPR